MKKKFFRSLSVILAIMMMALMIPTMTASADTTATHDIKMPAKPTSDESNAEVYYKIYKVATATVDANGVYSYSVVAPYNSVLSNEEKDGNTTGNLKYGDSVLTDSITAEVRAKLVKALVAVSNSSFVNDATQSANNGSENGTKAGETYKNLPIGYYLLVPSIVTADNDYKNDLLYGALLVPVTSSDVTTLSAKSSTIDLTKTIESITDKNQNSKNNGAIDNNNQTGTVGNGSTVVYKIETTFPSYLAGTTKIKNFVIKDSPAEGINISCDNDHIQVFLGTSSTALPSTNYTLEPGATLENKSKNNKGFTITFNDDVVLSNPATKVTVKVTATIDNPEGLTYTDKVASLVNEAELKYDNNYYSSVDSEGNGDDKPGDGTKDSTATVYETELIVLKKFDGITSEDDLPEGTKFKLECEAVGYSQEITIQKTPTKTYEWDEDNKAFKIKFTGLQEGTYTLSESATAANYKTAETRIITITATENDQTGAYTYTYTNTDGGPEANANNNVTITNYPGTSLPGAGGMGTVIFTVAGIAVVLLAGVMFVLYMRKRRIED